MFETVLVANRGEIARRIIRTCRDMGLRAVAVYSDADREQPFVAEADLALRLGPPAPAESYLDIPKLIALATDNGVDAIHPGYGFLAENAAFSAACAEAGIGFIGPPPEVIRAMGDKAEAKQKMEAAGVPVLPGYVGDEQDDTALLDAANTIGFPVLLKAVAGGGGRGIRLVESGSAFSGELESARREAQGAFGDGRVMIEKFLTAPRHVEFQVLADRQGKTLHLFERECSIQRRHQKIVEETPSPALDPDLRNRMAEAAVQAAHAIFYVGAGTVEFLVDEERRFYFLEMNTRLQVEHPITELTLGLDLVRLQIEIAEGKPLQLAQRDLSPKGHAIECRLNAEDPGRDFLPATGTLRAFTFPAGAGLRSDAGYDCGGTVGPHYDSLLAKLVAWGPDRDEALRRMGRLLADSRVSGIPTNLPFLQGVIAHPAFRGGEYSTRFLEQHGDALLAGDLSPEAWREVLLAAAGVDAWLEWAQPVQLPRGDGTPWRLLEEAPRLERPPALLHRRYTLAERSQGAEVRVLPGGSGVLALTVSWEDSVHSARFHGRPAPDGYGGEGVLELDGLLLPLRWDASGSERWLVLRGRQLCLRSENPAEAGRRLAEGEEATEHLRAPLPGRVLKLEVAEGDTVEEAQPLLVLEAMKMEHKMTAPFAGRVRHIRFAEGELVKRDDLLIELEPEGAGGEN